MIKIVCITPTTPGESMINIQVLVTGFDRPEGGSDLLSAVWVKPAGQTLPDFLRAISEAALDAIEIDRMRHRWDQGVLPL